MVVIRGERIGTGINLVLAGATLTDATPSSVKHKRAGIANRDKQLDHIKSFSVVETRKN